MNVTETKILRRRGENLFLALALLLGLTTSCRTPDLKPFRDSTARIQGSVAEAQEIYSGELGRLKSFVPDEHQLAKTQKAFTTNWQARNEVMEAMVRYAGSLAAVADAPDKARAGMESVANSVKGLGVAAGPYAPAIEGGSQIALELMDLANRVRAARQLKKAVVVTDPSMQSLAKLLAKDFATLRKALEQNQKSIKNLMDGPLSQQLDARQAVLNKATEKAKALQDGVGQPGDAVGTYNREMAETHKYLVEADKWYLPHKAEVELAQRELADRIKLFRDTETAIVDWGKAHADLTHAVQHNMTPDWTLLKQSADRIEKGINQIANRK